MSSTPDEFDMHKLYNCAASIRGMTIDQVQNIYIQIVKFILSCM